MNIIPCEKNKKLRKQIEKYAEVLKVKAHLLGDHGLSETEFYNSGLFRGAIERIRGQFSATMREKREFVQHVLNHMQDNNYIKDWESAGETYRHDYSVKLNSGRIASIELKGCLDGNNTNIFERPANAHEFILWSVCTNPGADPKHNAWSGIHTRLSAEIRSKEQRIDGVIFWDMVCGTIGRPCPKAENGSKRILNIGPFKLPPPCIYVLPSTLPSPRNNPNPPTQKIEDVEILAAFNNCFLGNADEINYVEFHVEYSGTEIMRTTTVKRNGEIQQESKPTAIKRT